MNTKYKTISALGGLGLWLYSVFCPVNVNATPEFNQNAEGKYEIVNPKNKDTYVSSGVNDPKAQALMQWLGMKSENFIANQEDANKWSEFATFASSAIEKSSTAGIFYDLDRGLIKIRGMNQERTFETPAYQQAKKAEEEEAANTKILESQEQRQEIKRKPAKEEKKEKKKKEFVASEEDKQRLAEDIDYIHEGKTGFRKKYLYDDFESLTDSSLIGKNFSEIQKELTPLAAVFETVDKKDNVYKNVDIYNENGSRHAAVSYAVDKDGKINSIELLPEKGLERAIIQYAKGENLIVKPVEDVLKTVAGLPGRTANYVDMQREYMDGRVILVLPDKNGVEYTVNKEGLIKEILGLNKDQVVRAIEPQVEFSLREGSNRLEFDTIFANSGRINRTRGKIKVVSEGDLTRQLQMAYSSTNKSDEKLVLAASGFQGPYLLPNSNYTEGDLMVEYLSKNFKIRGLTGATKDHVKFDDTVSGIYTLQQESNGQSTIGLNVGAEYRVPWEVPLIAGDLTFGARLAGFSGNDTYKYAWLDQNGNVLVEGSKLVPSDYMTGNALIELERKFGKGKFKQNRKTSLVALLEAENNKFQQEKNGAMEGVPYSKTTAGLKLNHEGKAFGKIIIPSLGVFYQTNDKSGINQTNSAGYVQLAAVPAENVAAIVNMYTEGMNNSNEVRLRLAHTKRAKAYIDNEGKFLESCALWNINNNAALLPEVHPDIPYIPQIHNGSQLEYVQGTDRYGVNFNELSADLGIGKGYTIGLKNSTKGNESKYMLVMKKNFKR